MCEGDYMSFYIHIRDLCFSRLAHERGLLNIPNNHQLNNLHRVIELGEQIRSLLDNRPIEVLSGFRTHEVNALLNAPANSAYVEGLAMDFICPDFGSPNEIVIAIAKSDLTFDQLIGKQSYVYVGLTDHKYRREVLFYKDGKYIPFR